METWEKIGFVEGNGTSTSPKNYSYSDHLSAYGDVSYRLKQIDYDGSYEYSNEIIVKGGIKPDQYSLGTKLSQSF